MPLHFILPAPSKATPSSVFARRIFLRDKHRCVYCGAVDVPLEIDHARAKAHFPASAAPSVVNDRTNLVTACVECNAAKGPQNLQGFAAMLRGRGVPAQDVTAVVRRVRAALRRPLP
jgi:5-methylcytosine-specific restriction endonuclease McrA